MESVIVYVEMEVCRYVFSCSYHSQFRKQIILHLCHSFFSFFLGCRQVSTEEGEAKAREFGVMFIETSAKAGFNIKVSTS